MVSPMLLKDDDEDDKKSLSRWDLLVKGVAALLVSATIAFYGIHSERKQFETAERNRRAQIIVETINSREMAAADMRARMFDTLVQHYFGNRQDEATKVAILEMIGHNFENDLNLKPLFMRLDAELAASGSKHRESLREAAGGIARSEIQQIMGAGGEACTLELTEGAPASGDCIMPIQLTLSEVREDRIIVQVEPGPPQPATITYFDLPMVNNRTLGELRYGLTLSSTDPEEGKAILTAVRLPTSHYDVENQLRVDQMLSDLTLKEF